MLSTAIMLPHTLALALALALVHPTLAAPQPSTRHIDISDLCRSRASKQEVYLRDAAHVFSGNLTGSLLCHIELHLPSDHYGFSVFIDEMRLESSAGCRKDYLQFGRWVSGSP